MWPAMEGHGALRGQESSNPPSQFFSANKSSRLLGCGGPFCRCRALAAAHVKSFASKHIRFLTSSKAHDQYNRTERGVTLRRFQLEMPPAHCPFASNHCSAVQETFQHLKQTGHTHLNRRIGSSERSPPKISQGKKALKYILQNQKVEEPHDKVTPYQCQDHAGEMTEVEKKKSHVSNNKHIFSDIRTFLLNRN